MKTSTTWLSRYVDLPWEPRELAEKLTLAGLEVEGIETIGEVPDTVVVGKILTREAHPNADRLSVCTVDVGGETPLQIVCGAPNCDIGVKAPCALIGTTLGEGFTIRKAKLRGVRSEGMLCAEDELGLGTGHQGIMELPNDAEVGAPLATILERDTVIDWEVTPNRPDWNSHIGIAREIGAVGGRPETFRLPQVELPGNADEGEPPCSVEVQDADLCPRYVARVIRNVTIGPSPEWMQASLLAVGIRPINNVVDITNYVLMECGQPLHAFDYDLLADHRIVVRRALPSDKLVTLDGVERPLTPDTLLICDGERAVALAGVMGGANTEIRDETRTVLLESACFDRSNIRATSRRVGLGSESSYRFERGVDIEMTEWASRRAAALMCELAGGELVPGVVDLYPSPYEAFEVTARFARVRELLGVDISAERMAEFLRGLGLSVATMDAERITLRIPPHRRFDLLREVDIIEEIARLHGLDNIPGSQPVARLGGRRAVDTYYPLEEARHQLRGLGLDETLTYSFVNPQAAVRCTGVDPGQLVQPCNPLSNELGAMRPSLVPGVMATVAHNVAHGNDDLAFFELGRVMVHDGENPEERWQIAIILSGRKFASRPGEEKNLIHDFFDLKGILEGWFEARRLAPACRADQHPALRDGTCATLSQEGVDVAVLGEVNEALTADIRLKHPLFLALIELDRVLAVHTAPRMYSPLPQFPAVTRDVSFIAGSSLTHRQVVEAILGLGEALIENVEVFDLYEDEEVLGAGRRSLAYTVVYRDRSKTLTDEEVNAVHDRVRAHLAANLGVELR